MPDLLDIERLQRQAAAARRLKALEAASSYATDPWKFMVERVNLVDPLTPEDPIRPYPDDDYLRLVVAEWEQHRKVIVWKPRRKRLSWSALAYAVAKAAHLPYQRVFLVAKRQGEDDTQGSRELLWRAGFIIEQLRGAPPISADIGKLLITIANGSTISAVTSEPDALRGLAGAIVVGDEFGIWDEPEASLAAFIPALEKRGQFLGISSSVTGYFHRAIYDLEEGEEPRLDEFGVPQHAKDITTYPGLEAVSEEVGRRWMQSWTNPKNGFRIVSFELEADSRTRTEEQLRELRADYSDAIWDTELRKGFHIRGGKPIFAREYNPRSMVKDQLPVIPTEPLLIGLDFGYHRPAACVAQIAEGVQLRIYRCLEGEQTTTRAFVRHLLYKLEQWVPGWRGGVEWCCDHSGNRKRGEDETAEDVLRRDFKIRPRSKYSYIEPSLGLVRDYMNGGHRGEPGFLVAKNPDTVKFREGLQRGYRYPKATEANPNPDEPEKGNPYRDVMDAMRYIPLNFGGLHRTKRDPRQLLAIARRDIPRPRRYA